LPSDAGTTGADPGPGPTSSWTLLTNHGAALIYVAEHPEARITDVAGAIGVTERYAAQVLADLRAGGYLHADRVGRRNVYRLDPARPMRRIDTKHVSDLLAGLADIGNGALIDTAGSVTSDR
jgi:DNA-binding IscR family transcriptional regulator